ncbi:MAG: AAA-like domain-containing protein [Chloroflexota bacterium]
MRKFYSYGPVDTDLHFYSPRTALIDDATARLVGDDPNKGGHYITVWAPRQTGKTWTMQQVMQKIKHNHDFEVGIITMQSAKEDTDSQSVLDIFVQGLRDWFERDFPDVIEWKQLASLFTSTYFSKPVILIIDEFDSLEDPFINRFASEFRTIHTKRSNQISRNSAEKRFLLHGLALIGVRSVLGIENTSGSPFNVQKSVHMPNLTATEVQDLFRWYEQESGQRLLPEVVERIYDEFQGQPGLTCWMGELLTETHNRHDTEITLFDFNTAYTDALDEQPNNNILNIIAKAKMTQYTPTVLSMYKTNRKLAFRYDNPVTNYLYMNGVVGRELVREPSGINKRYLKFPSPFVQKRLFNYFADDLFMDLEGLYDSRIDLSTIITETHLDIPNLLQLYESYLQQNRRQLFRNAPRRKTDERIYEAVYHFNFYMYLTQFLADYDASVYPEFPTGNGKIDLLITHNGTHYWLELKSFANQVQYRKALTQAAAYAAQLKVAQIWLVFFVEMMDDERRVSLETAYRDAVTGVVVQPLFVEIVE